MNRPKRAVPFIIKNEQTHCYQLTKQAEDLLKTVDKNISVVSVAGLYRTGKSYLLNSVILDKKSIFGVGPTVNPCTKGLWLWVEPDPTSEKRSMLVIDTEGLGALDEQANHDMKIFCLAVLLSTTFIYNSVGSIDQNALQTLSLVLNLVSNIDQQNTSNRPQFIWVVRDFTLQLVDQKGKTLTPHQYLQMALTTNTKQQQKTTIRKTITTAFANRDCFTLVKPLIDEVKLQNLDQVSMEQLRPEFVSQSIQLRNKIKSTLKQFKLTSSQNNITGKQYILVAQKYLAAINSGAVPNMVDTWTFIKQEKSREAIEEIRKIYTEKIKTKILSKIPMKKSILDDHFKNMKQEIRSVFLKMTYDQSSTQLIDQFVSNAYSQIQKLNYQQNKQQIKILLNKQYQPFMKKLYSQYYATYEQYQKQILKNYKDALTQKYMDKIDDIREHIQRFADQKLIQNFKFFQKKLKEEMKGLKTLKEELEVSLNRQLSQLNQIKEKERRIQQQKIFDLEKRIRLYENQREQIVQFGKAQKVLIETNLDLLKRKNQQLSSTIQELNRQIGNLQKAQNQLKEKSYIQNKQYQKEKALFGQKQQYMNAKIRQLQQKSIQLQSKINETGGKFQSERKGMTKQYQDKIEYLEQQNKRLAQKSLQTENKLSKILDQAKQMSQQIQNLRQNNVSQKKKYELRIMQAESQKKPSKVQFELRQENQDLLNQLQKANEKINQPVKRLKMMQQEIKNLQNNSQKQIAIHVQQIQFQQLQITDLKSRYEELKKSYQNALQNLHDNSKNQESSMQVKIYQLTTEHQRQMKNRQMEYDERVKSFKKEIQMLQRHKQEMALQQSLERKNLQAKQKEWRQTNSMFQNMIKKLEDKLQSSQKDHQDVSKEKQSFYSIRLKQLEQQIQEIKERASIQIAQNSKKSQQAFAVLKHYSQIEKQQWEKRFVDEKDRAEKRVKSVRDELEKKLSQQKSAYEDEINELQNRLVHMQRIFNQKLQNMQYDHDIAMQKITNQFMEQKVQLNKQLALTQQKLDIMKNNFEKEMVTKIKHYQATIQNIKTSLRQQFQQTVRRLTEQKESFQSKYEAAKKTSRSLEQNIMILKSEADKQRAVYKEKEKSMQKKIIQLQNRLQSQLAIYNKTIETINERHGVQVEKLNEQIDKLNFNVATLQQERDKLETEHENNISRLQAKLKVVEQSKNKNKQDYEDIVNKFQCAVTHFGNQKKKLMIEKQKGIEQFNEKTNQCIKQVEQGHKKMLKQSEDRIARLVTENKSLKQRILMIEIEKTTNSTTKKTFYDQSEKEKMDRKYEKRVQEYKQLYQRQKQKTKKLKEENGRLRMQAQGSSFAQGNSTITYYERPSFSQISNSRLYNGSQANPANTTQVKRKFTNTPTVTQRKGSQPEQYSGMLRFNAGTGYKYRQ